MSRTLQKLIHVGCRELGLDDETRRDLQLVATGKASMADMTLTDLERVVAALKARGFHPSAGTGKGRRAHAPAPRPDLRFIHVMWRLLGECGALNTPGRGGLNAFVRARFEKKWGHVPLDIDALRDAGEINDVTRALKDWCARVGVALDQ